VSQLLGETIEEDLEGLFTGYGVLKEIRLGLEKDGRCKGYAYVEFEDEQSARKALAEHGKLVNGQAISVLISDPSLAPKKQTQKMAMVPPSLSRPKPRARLNLK
jgi:RNA recognition motif-containing protein